MNFLTLENVTKSYGEKVLFQGISLHIDKGQKIGLIAKNGTGKTTLMRVIAGRESSEGESARVTLRKDIRIGWLDQDPDFHPDQDVLGAVLDNPELGIVERHLGLMPANEAATAGARIATIADTISDQVDIDRLLQATATDEVLRPRASAAGASQAQPALRLGIARDPAFGFYYADDLDALQQAGAELVFFSPIADARLPKVDALFLGGGFPECFMRELEANRSMRDSVRQAIESGLPAYAECGGLMYLARSLSWRDEKHAMAGVIAADVLMHDKPVGRGYVRLAPTADHPWLPAGSHPDEIPAHEFHYSSLEHLDPATRFGARVL